MNHWKIKFDVVYFLFLAMVLWTVWYSSNVSNQRVFVMLFNQFIDFLQKNSNKLLIIMTLNYKKIVINY